MVSGCEQEGALPHLGSAAAAAAAAAGFITISGLHKVEGQGASAGRSITPSPRLVWVESA